MVELTNLQDGLELVGKRLRLLREIQGYSQRELAKRSGITHSNISMIEQGQISPSIQSIQRILTAFSVSLSDFFNQMHVASPQLLKSLECDLPLTPPQTSTPPTTNYQINVHRLGTEAFTREIISICLTGKVITPLCSVGETSLLGHVLQGETILYCLSGEMELRKGNVFMLSAGDFYCFKHQGNNETKLSLS